VPKDRKRCQDPISALPGSEKDRKRCQEKARKRCQGPISALPVCKMPTCVLTIQRYSGAITRGQKRLRIYDRHGRSSDRKIASRSAMAEAAIRRATHGPEAASWQSATVRSRPRASSARSSPEALAPKSGSPRRSHPLTAAERATLRATFPSAPTSISNENVGLRCRRDEKPRIPGRRAVVSITTGELLTTLYRCTVGQAAEIMR
jgi:hypothetical protein